jgi:hypothetical protein
MEQSVDSLFFYPSFQLYTSLSNARISQIHLFNIISLFIDGLYDTN